AASAPATASASARTVAGGFAIGRVEQVRCRTPGRPRTSFPVAAVRTVAAARRLRSEPEDRLHLGEQTPGAALGALGHHRLLAPLAQLALPGREDPAHGLRDRRPGLEE